MSTQNIDFHELVNRVANRFEETTKIGVEEKARLALITPAIPHKNNVEEALGKEEITIEFLENCILEVLNNAVELYVEEKSASLDSTIEPTQLNEINESDIAASLEENCPYVFWC